MRNLLVTIYFEEALPSELQLDFTDQHMGYMASSELELDLIDQHMGFMASFTKQLNYYRFDLGIGYL